MFNSLKYVYSLAEKDFYNVNIKDVFKVLLNNITNSDSLKVLGLRMDNETCSQMQSDEYNNILPLMVFSLAVRIPTLKNVTVGSETMTDEQIYKVYTSVINKGAQNTNDIITETFLETKYLIRKNKKLPPFTADWYKNYIYAYVPAIAEITNKNIFLLGVADIYFSMFYACFEEAFHDKVADFVTETGEFEN
jgi:hypothetical protein